MTIVSSWEVDYGWARPLGAPPPRVPERIEAAPSLRGTPHVKDPYNDRRLCNRRRK